MDKVIRKPIKLEELKRLKEIVKKDIGGVKEEGGVLNYKGLELLLEGYEYGIDITERYATMNAKEVSYLGYIIRQLKEGVDLREYIDKKVSKKTLKVIRYAKEKGIDLKKYVEEGFSTEQLKEIRLGLEKGIDISYYADTRYSRGQMYEIREGLEAGIDVSYYADININRGYMRAIRLRLLKEGNLNVEGVDIERYKKEGYRVGQIEEIVKGVKRGLDISMYSSKDYTEEQMQEIRLGLEGGLEVKEYANPRNSDVKMFYIRQGLEKGIDITLYKDLEDEEEIMKIYRGEIEYQNNVLKMLENEESVKEEDVLIIKQGLREGTGKGIERVLKDLGYEYALKEEVKKGKEEKN